MSTKNHNKDSARCSHYLARGALIWGPIYTTGVSGMAYAIAPSILGDAPAYSDVLLNSLMICPSLGAAGGYLRWKITRPESVDAAGGETPSGGRTSHRFRPRRRMAHREAA